MSFGYNLQANGIRQHLIRWDGPDGAPQLLLIPGITSPAVTWGFIAERLADRIEAFSGVRPPVGSLDITLYRDDLRGKPHRPLERTSVPPGGVDGSLVVLVDDVLFSGTSMGLPVLKSIPVAQLT